MQAGTDKKALLLHGQVQLLFNAVPNSVLANVIGSLIAFFIYADRIPPLRLYPWIGLLLAVTLLRLVHYWRFKAAAPGPQDIDRWYLHFRIHSLLLAGVVGSAGFLLFDYGDSLYQMVLALMMVCIASFAITTMAPSTELAVTFLVLLLAPLTGSLFLAHSIDSFQAVWIMPVTLFMLVMSALRISRNIKHNIELTIEAQQHERRMQDFQQRLALYFRETPLAVLEWDRIGNVLQWNPAAERLFGYGAQEAQGKQLTALVASSRSLRRLETLWEEMNTSRSSAQLVMENRVKDGTLRQCEWFNTPLIDATGNIIGVISLIQDVTQREENDRIKQEFISIVSHELRTPVTAIKGGLGLVASGMMDDEPEKVREMLLVALDNTNRLHMLVNDILSVDTLESGHMDFRFASADLLELVQRVISANDALARQAAINLDLVAPPDALPVHMDPDRIFQVVTNILANAIKFAHSNTSVTITLTAADGRVKVAVHNVGEIIQPSEREKLFSRFSQRDSSTTRTKGGTGLGLYICRKILENHGSELDFVSTDPEGTIFFFELPLATAK